MNLLCTAVDDAASRHLDHHIDEWRRRRQIVASVPIQQLLNYLRFDPSSTWALVDAIICGADTNMTFGEGYGEVTYPLETALKVAFAVCMLPENCTMRDGRKWKTIPFAILTRGVYVSPFLELPDNVKVLPPVFERTPSLSLRAIREYVNKYWDRVLADYDDLGMLATPENGHIKIRPALRRKDPTAESLYYVGRGDRRSSRGWVTVRRDSEGLRHDVEVFQHMLDQGATETQMQRFFDQNPALLMDVFLGIPLSHQPTFVSPVRATPDYSLLPILGLQGDATIRLLELKGPNEAILAGRPLHRGLAAKVHHAVDQVRDYERYLRDPANAKVIEQSLGRVPASSNRAVLIGRTPRNDSEREVLLQRQSEIDVAIVTYDQILQVQAEQVAASAY